MLTRPDSVMTTSKSAACFFLACTLAFAGCKSVPYEPPAADKTASLTLTSAATTGKVKVSTFADSDGCKEEQVIASKDPGSGTFIGETTIPADQPFSLWIRHLTFGNHCDLVVTFDPVGGQAYEAVISANDAKCEVALLNATGGDLHIERSARLRKAASKIAGAWNFCVPDSARSSASGRQD
jgi:hypothetical protein